MNTGGTVKSSGTVNTYNNLTLAGGTLQSNGGFSSGWGSFALLGNLNVTANSLIVNVSGSNNAITPGEFNGNRTLNINVSNGATLTNGLAVSDSGNATYSITKSGLGTATFAVTNTYTGSTTINAGILNVTGSLAAGSAVTVGGAGGSGTPTLAGTSTINGATTIAAAGGGAAGVHSVGDRSGAASTVGTQTFSSTLSYGSGSLFEWDLNASGTSDPGAGAMDAATGTYDKVIANGASGSVTGSSSVFKVVLGGNSFADAFWDTAKSWTNIFSGTGTPASLASIFTSFSPTGGLAANGTVAGQGQFTFTGSTLSWSAVPEPSGTLAGLLVGAGLLRRRRDG